MSGLLTRRALVLAAVESTPGVDANPTAAANALLAIEPAYSVDPTVLERRIATPDLSPLPHVIGRKLGRISFQHEVRGNGLVQSGLLADAPRIVALLRMCGFEAVSVQGGAAAIVQTPIPGWANSGPTITWAPGGSAPGYAEPVMFTIEVTTGGASGTARVSIFNNNAAVAGPTQTNLTATSGTSPLALGTTGLTIQPTWTGNLVLGDTFTVLTLPNGVTLRPRSTGFETGTIYAYFDGLMHRLTHAMGTFSLQAEAGNYPTMNFEFSGNYVATTDTAMPANPVFEQTLPQQIENAALTLNRNTGLLAAGFTLDVQNTVSPRLSVNHADGYNGFRLTARNPVGTISPEATLEASHPFWADMAVGAQRTFYADMGGTRGNSCLVFAPRTQIGGLTYGDRDGLRTYDVNLAFKRGAAGDDELRIHFY